MKSELYANSLLCEFDNGLAVVLDGDGKVIRQLVSFKRMSDRVVRFSDYEVALTYPTKAIAMHLCKQMGWPQTHIERGFSRFSSFWYIRYDFRSNYALACWDA